MHVIHHWCLIYFPKKKDLTRSNSRFNPNFYKIDVSVRSPPGSYYISNFDERTTEDLNVASLVRAHATPDCSIHDITENLASDLLDKFPAAIDISIAFQPNYRNICRPEDLVTAQCTFNKLNSRTKGPTTEQDSIYKLTTEWRLPKILESGLETSLLLTTEERSVSPVHGQISDLKHSSFPSSLNHVHPTVGVHEAIARVAGRLQSVRTKGALLLLAKYSFHLADKQSPCKRLQQIYVRMKEVAPLPEVSQTKREAVVERPKKIFDNDYVTFCSVLLGRDQYEQSQRSLLSSDVRKGQHRACLALGSNLGNRVEMIESALREMSDRGLTVLRSSALYETKPMYLENQESFINGACEVCSTDASSYPR